MAHVVLSRSFADVVTLEEACAHLRVWDNEDNDYIQSLIETAVQTAESYMNRIIGLATVLVEMADLDRLLPMGFANSLKDVTYFNDNTEEYEVLPPEFYSLSPLNNRIYLKRAGRAFLSDKSVSHFHVSYITGWESSEIPAPIKHGILLLIGSLYEMREDATVGVGVTVTVVPITHRYLFNKYKLYSV